MEGRLRIFLLRALALALVMTTASGCSLFRGPAEEAAPDAGTREPVIEPEVARREVAPPKIDTENFEVGAFIGFMSVEDFETNAVYGVRGAYHITEGLFVEATYGQSDAGTTSFERLSGGAPLLTDDDRTFKYYALSLGYNLLPGEVFIGRNRAFNSALYVLLGAGNTTFGGEDLFTWSLGAGYRMLLTDAIALHVDVKDHVFDTDLLGDDKTAHNIEFHLGATWFF